MPKFFSSTNLMQAPQVLQLLKATTHQRNKDLKAQSLLPGGMATLATPGPSDACSRPCWHFPDSHALVLLEMHPRKRPGSTPSPPVWHPWARSCASEAAPPQPCSGLQDHDSQGLAPPRG